MDNALLYGVNLFVVDVPWYVIACVPFMKNRHMDKWLMTVIIIGLGLLNSVVGFLMVVYIPNWRDLRWVHYLAQVALLLIFYYIAFRLPVPKLLYTILLLQAISTAVNFLAYSVLVPFYPNTSIGMSTTPAYLLAVMGGNLFAVPISWIFFKGRLRQAFEELPLKSILLLCMTPVLFLFISQGYVYLAQSIGLSNSGIAAINLLIIATGLISYYINVRTALDSVRHTRMESELSTQLALQVQGYENLTRSIETARAARHDLRHHMNVIREYADKGDTAELVRYINEYMNSQPLDNIPDWCENRAVNALLKHYLAQGSEAGAQLDVKLDLPARAGVTDTDLCVVFGNVFENAATSIRAMNGGYIRARCENGVADIVLIVENSTGDNEPRKDGLGLKNVEAIAKKYGGSARFEKSGGVYHSKIILMKNTVRKE